MGFFQKLNQAIDKNNSLLCIGLDSDINKLPEHIKSAETPLFNFNKEIINTTFDLVCAYKINAAFYESLGIEGMQQLKATFDYLKATYPEIPIIYDSKRADIGNSMQGYVSAAYDFLGADAMTVSPYLGHDAVKPALERAEQACFVLCRTSNPGSQEFQELSVSGAALFEIVAKDVYNKWNMNNNCGLVVGATYPDEISRIRYLAPQIYLLIPGIGAQGGELESVLKAGLNENKKGLIINVSRSIIYAGTGDNFAQLAREEAQRLKIQINTFRAV